MEELLQYKSYFPEKAEWWRRLIGWIIDIFPITIVAMIITELNRNPEMLQAYFAMIYISYCVLFEGIFSRTLGKFLTGTIVLNSNTFEEPSLGQVLGRSFSKLIPFDFLSFLSYRPRGWHDSIPNTMVTTIKSRRFYKTRNWEIDYYSANFIQKRIIKLKSLNKGIYRLIITFGILLPLLLALFEESNVSKSDGVAFFNVLFWGSVVYWISILIGIWIYEGFEDEK